MGRKKQDLRRYGAGTVKPVLDKEGNQRTGKGGGLLWSVRISLGIDPVTHVVRQKQAQFEGKKEQAYDFAAVMRHEAQEKGLRTEDTAQTFSGFLPIWEKSLRCDNHASADSIAKYLQQISHIEPYIGARRMEDLQPEDIEEALVKLSAESKLGATTVNKVFSFAKRVFKYAHGRGYITRNPCDTVRAPKPNKTQRRSLSIEEAQVLTRKLDEAEAQALEEYHAKEGRQADHGNLFGRSQVLGVSKVSAVWAVRLALATGMRRGELCALRWGQVDLDGGKVNVIASLPEQPKKDPLTGEPVPKEPKTAAGFRSISIDPETVARLRTWKKTQAAMLARIQAHTEAPLHISKQTDETPVCCSCVGGFFLPSLLERWWRSWRKQAGFPTLKLHELRHTQATVLLGSGIDLATVQTRLGHEKPSTTLDFYSHALPGNDEKAAGVIGGLLTVSKPAVLQVNPQVIKQEKTA